MMEDTDKEACSHKSLHNEVDQLHLSTNHLKNLVFSMSVVLSERVDRTQEYEALLTLFDSVRHHIEKVQETGEKITELLEPCGKETS